MVGGKSPDYIAADNIKNSVGFKSSSNGVNGEIDYKKSFKADFKISFLGIKENPVTKKQEINANVMNVGNLTDAGKITLFAGGVQAGKVHHYELAPGKQKVISFSFNPSDVKNIHQIILTSKYKSISKTM
jgi:beta-glucosidase